MRRAYKIGGKVCGVGGSARIGAKLKLLLDIYPDAKAAYSLRKLSVNYSGSAIRVRRSSDGAEQDIGFVSNSLDTVSLLTFVGDGDGFISKWYDQIVNNDAVQTTPANQPKIVDAGTLITELDKPAVKFDGTASYLSADGLATIFIGEDKLLWTFARISELKDSSTGYVCCFGNSGAVQPFRGINWQKTNFGLRERDSENLFGGDISVNAGNYIHSAYSTGNLNENFINGNSAGQKSVNLGPIYISNFKIGVWDRGSFASFFNEKLQELIIYSTDQSSNRLNIEKNLNNYYNVELTFPVPLT